MKTIKKFTKSLLVVAVLLFYQCNPQNVEEEITQENFILQNLELTGKLQDLYGETNKVILTIEKDEEGEPIARFTLKNKPIMSKSLNNGRNYAD